MADAQAISLMGFYTFGERAKTPTAPPHPRTALILEELANTERGAQKASLHI
jgi:hypothetical protein